MEAGVKGFVKGGEEKVAQLLKTTASPPPIMTAGETNVLIFLTNPFVHQSSRFKLIHQREDVLSSVTFFLLHQS